MMRAKARFLVGLLPGVLATACVFGVQAPRPVHVPPAPDAPHATVKLRTTYLSTPAVSEFVHEHAYVDGLWLPLRGRTHSFGAPAATATTVVPGWRTWYVTTELGHWAQRYKREPYQVSESYYCGSSSTGASSMCTRTVTRYRTVLQTYRVTDGQCTAVLMHHVEAGNTYRIGFTYSSPNTCSLTCIREVADDNGARTNAPCLTDRNYVGDKSGPPGS